MKRVCVVTGSRADYGLLRPLMKAIELSPFLDLNVLATGAHLSPEFGLTVSEIEDDGFDVHYRLELLMSSDSLVGVTKSTGLGLTGFADAYMALKPDVVVLLGDRFEVFSGASAAMLMNMPIAHIHGGELSFGAIDDSIRHAITKMAHLHFVSTERYKQRVIQLGESPNCVFNTGSLGVESINSLQLLSRELLEEKLDFDLSGEFAVVTFHPETRKEKTSRQSIQALFEALNQIPQLKVLFTKANSDAEGRHLNTMIDDFVRARRTTAKAFLSLGQLNYLSSVKHALVVIGNSSSGIIEAPSLKTASLNIGDRQKGRVSAPSVIHCGADVSEISEALAKAVDPEFQSKIESTTNPYDNGASSKRIVSVLESMDLSGLIDKSFYDL